MPALSDAQLAGIRDACAREPSLDPDYRNWLTERVSRIEADFNRSADTHLLPFSLPGLEGIDLYLKDESTHPTGSLKHRLARSLFLYGLCNGRIRPGATVVEASSGSTAVSEAYFAKLLDIPFIAVIPHGTSLAKMSEIERFGGTCHSCEPKMIYAEAERIARETGGCYLDQFTYAERATDWRGNNNIAESLFEQMELERFPAPEWVIVGAGTGGTSATIGRFIRYRPEMYAHTKLCVADPDNSVFFESYRDGCRKTERNARSRIEGVGRPRVEPSFIDEIVDLVIKVSDEASIGTTHWLEQRLKRRCGPSTGLNVYAMISLALQMKARGDTGSLVTLICDGGERYSDTIYNADWLKTEEIDTAPTLTELDALFPAA